MFAIAVRFDMVDADAARTFDSLAAEALVGIREREPDTLVYAVHTVDDDPLARVFYEVYTGRDAHARHEANPSTHRFLEQVSSLTTSVRAEFLGAPAGKVSWA
jgi:quinol monooxygenase YgiN